MENINLIESFAEFKEFKNIDRATLMSVLEDIFRNMLLKRYGTDENFDIIINIDKGDLEIWRNRTVVEDSNLQNPNTEIALSEAKKIDADYEIGEEVTDAQIEELKAGKEKLMNSAQKLFAKMYEQTQGAGAQGAGPDMGAQGAGNANDDVVDGEFTEV